MCIPLYIHKVTVVLTRRPIGTTPYALSRLTRTTHIAATNTVIDSYRYAMCFFHFFIKCHYSTHTHTHMTSIKHITLDARKPRTVLCKIQGKVTRRQKSHGSDFARLYWTTEVDGTVNIYYKCINS